MSAPYSEQGTIINVEEWDPTVGAWFPRCEEVASRERAVELINEQKGHNLFNRGEEGHHRIVTTTYEVI